MGKCIFKRVTMFFLIFFILFSAMPAMTSHAASADSAQAKKAYNYMKKKCRQMQSSSSSYSVTYKKKGGRYVYNVKGTLSLTDDDISFVAYWNPDGYYKILDLSDTISEVFYKKAKNKYKLKKPIVYVTLYSSDGVMIVKSKNGSIIE